MKSAKGVALIFTGVVGLMLSGCGAPQAAQSFVEGHTRCPGAVYDNPVFSADGSSVYYATYATVAEDTVDMHVVRLDGSGDRLVEANARPDALSPDGTMLLFTRPNPDPTQGSDFFVLDLATMETRLVAETATSAEWSPDSQWIVYVAADSLSGPIEKTNVITGEVVVLAGTSGDARDWGAHPVWSPDPAGTGSGSRIAFGSGRDGKQAVVVMSADGGGLIRLTPPPGAACAQPEREGYTPMTWLPEGDGLVVFHRCSLSATLRMITTRGDLVSSWDNLPPRYAYSLEWSPRAGRFLLWMDESIITADFDGSDAATLRQGVTYPRWSPDGKQIVFAGVDQDLYQEIFVMSADGTGLAQITQNPGAGRICLH